MATTVNINFRIDERKRLELDKIAEALDRDRSYVLNEAVEQYLIGYRAEAAAIEEGLADIEAGRYKSLDQVRKEFREKTRKALAKKTPASSSKSGKRASVAVSR